MPKQATKKLKTGRIRLDNENAIRMAAESEFATKGFKGTSMLSISKLTGIPRPNIHYYFKNKEEIYQTILIDILEFRNKSIEQITSDKEPSEALSRFIYENLMFAKNQPKLSKIYANEILNGAPFLLKYLKKEYRSLIRQKTKVIKIWISQGKMDPVNPYYLIFLIWASTHHYADFGKLVNLILDKRRLTARDYECIADNLIHIIVRGCGIKFNKSIKNANKYYFNKINDKATRSIEKSKLLHNQQDPDTRARIINAAEQEFAKYGYNSTSLNSIANRAHLQRPHLYYYFKNKLELYGAVLANVIELWMQAFDQISPNDNPAEALAKYIRTKVTYSMTNPLATRIYACEILHEAPHLSTFRKRDQRKWEYQKASVINSWIKKKKMDAVDPMYLIFLIWSSTEYYANYDIQIKAVLNRKKFSKNEIEDIANNLIHIILKGCGIKISNRL